MRVLSLVLGGLLVAGAAHADVKLVIRRDGKKEISNITPATTRGTDLSWLSKRHDRRSQFDPIIERYAAKYNVDPTLVRAVIQVESNFNPACVSHKGARGLMQLMPETAKRFGVTNIHDPEQNIHGGVKYLSYLMRLFNEDMPRVLAGYNAGENAVLKYGGIPPYQETSNYVTRALTVYHGRPYGTATSFRGRRGKPLLRGGFGRAFVAVW
ncbi:MAG: lytic transglycosylase domain-containing protein [Acidobacteriota bacterium]|nr:lytic transglycosylase domain-containing protein [Acidobacteriota bacterium]